MLLVQIAAYSEEFTWSFKPDAKRLRREVATNRAVHAVDPIEARFE